MRVLVVDDSALMRRWLKQCFEEACWTVETARSGLDALEKIGAFDPQVVTLDVNMPEMDGLTCLANIMAHHPRPVVMVSSITTKGALATIEALQMGAVDYFEKPSGTVSLDLRSSLPEILAKVRAASGARTSPGRSRLSSLPRRGRLSGNSHSTPSQAKTMRAPALAGRAAHPSARLAPCELILIGVSTGGPGTLEHVLAPVDPDISAPILIAQHMPSRFAGILAERLNSRLAIEVTVLDGPTALQPGVAVVAGADTDVVVSRRGARLMAIPTPIDPSRLWHPSVERMVESALSNLPPEKLVGVLLTGMGDDGATAMTNMRTAGGRTIAEHERTAVIYGMPRELIARGGADRVLPSDQIGAALNAMVGTTMRSGAL